MNEQRTTVLSTETLQQLAPAAFASGHEMTSRYAMVETHRVIARLADVGYYPVDAKQERPRTTNPALGLHRVTLRHESYLDLQHVGSEIPQITVINSHNGRTNLRLNAGVFRPACANGMMIGRAQFQHDIRHAGDAFVEAMAFAENMTERLDELEQLVSIWDRVLMSRPRQLEFAQRAAALRFGPVHDCYDPAQLLNSRRWADDGGSLWKVFNRVQENCTKPGVLGRNFRGRQVRSGSLDAIGSNARFNKSLWNLAADIAEQ